MTILTVSGLGKPNTSKPEEKSPTSLRVGRTLPPHLGGHLNKTHTDRDLLTYLIETHGIKSMLDVGCGPGGMVEIGRLRGLDAFGIDGDFTLDYNDEIRPFIHVHDFTTGPAPIDGEFDLCWSVEFLEHVEEQYIPNYMEAFRLCKYVVATSSVSTRGHNHVNCQPQEYWQKVFSDYGLTFDPDATAMIRKKSSMQKPFMQNTGMFYRRNDE